MKSHVLYRYSEFRKLFLGKLIANIGDKFYTIALAWYILTADVDNGKFHLGLLMAINLLPIVLFGPFIGTLTDRWNKKFCLQLANAIRFVLLSILSLLLITNQLSLIILYSITFLQALCVPLFDTATQSSISFMTEKEDTPKAVSTNSSVAQISAVLGGLIGSILITIIGIEGAFVFNTISYLVSLFFVSAIQTDLSAITVKMPFLKQFKEGISYLSKHKPVKSLLILFGITNLFLSPLLVLLPILVKDGLQKGPDVLALLETSLAVGALIISIVLSFKISTHKVYPKIFGASVILGLGFIAIGNTGFLSGIIIALFVIGLMISYVNTIAFSLFHNEVSDEMKGRFFAVLYTIVYAVMPLSYSLVGFISGSVSVYTIFVVCGIVVILLSVFFLLIPRIKT